MAWPTADRTTTRRNRKARPRDGGPHQADWATPAQVKNHYGDASVLKGSRVVFNICGNKYRLVVKINYPYRVVYVRFVGTHSDYDVINAETV